MTATLHRAPVDPKAGERLSRRWGSGGHRDPVAMYVARDLGMRPQAAEKLINGAAAVNYRAAVIIRAFRALGDEDRLARFWEPLARAFEGREPPPLCAATLLLAQEADAAEDVDELRFLSDRSDANLARLVRAKRASVCRELAVLDALLEEQRQRAQRRTSQ
jgi:hypothetical protein